MITVIPLLLLVCSCEPDTYTVYMDENGNSGSRAEISLDLKGLEGTKTSLLSGSEQISSGAIVCVLLHSGGMMDSVQNISAEGNSSISVPIGQAVDLYVLGNLWALDAQGRAVSLPEAMGADFPSVKSALSELEYMLDGGELTPSYRREALKDVARFGIPYSGCLENITARPDERISITCRRLFSRITLTVDHHGLDGDKDDNWFRNISLHIRQANGMLKPFSQTGQRAESASDMIEGDYDSSMENGHKMTYCFYVPENMQGTLLPSNTDAAAKSLDHLIAEVGADRASLLTYVEFKGAVSREAGGYGADLVYRFYLGSDNCSNFDLQRGRDYDISLGFRVNSIFEPWWQLSVEGELDDTRKFCLTSDEAGLNALPDGQMIAVRKSRPGRAYVYMNKNGEMGRNALAGRSVADPDSYMGDLSDCAWTSNFLSCSNRSADVPKREDLQDLGINASYDQSTGMIEFSVADPSRFESGREVELTLYLLPGGKPVKALLRTYDDMSVTWDKSPSDGFYMGMARTASFRGFSGDLGFSSSCDGVLKQSASASDPFVFDSSSQTISSGESLKLYAWNDSASSLTMRFTPLDSFNDGGVCLEERLAVEKPSLLFLTPTLDVPLLLSGNLESVDAVYSRDPVLSDDSLIRITEFDEALYAQILEFSYQFGISPSQAETYAFKGTIGMNKAENTYVTGGYRRKYLFRKALSASVSEGCIPAEIKGLPKSYELRAVSACGIVSGNSRELVLLPLLNANSGVSFAPSYHDYSLIDTQYLDEPYKSCQTSYVAGGYEQIYEDAPQENLSAYAVPLEQGSLGYSSKSESIKVDMSEIFPYGRIKICFEDDGSSTKHSAGLHDIVISVRNRHSGEVMTGVLGQIKVYVDFVVGLELEMDYAMNDKVGFTAWPVLMSAIHRTSCADWFSSFGVGVIDAEEQNLIYEVFDPIVGDYVKVAKGQKNDMGPAFAHYENPYYNLYTVELEKYPSYGGFALDSMDEDVFSGFFKAGIWLNDVGGNPQKTVNVVVFGMRDDAAGGIGYYCFHRLQDLCESSNGWVRRYGRE